MAQAFNKDMNREWRLARRPVGDISPGDLELVTTEKPSPGAGEVLVRTVYLSLDPTNRIWMSDADGYLPPVGIGEVMRGGAIGVVEASNDPSLGVGTLVMPALGGWRDYAVMPAGMCRPLPRIPGFPTSGWLSVAGLTGVTAYYGMIELGKPKAGETVVVSAAAGAVGSIAGQLAKAAGARVVGIAGGAEKCRRLIDEFGFDGAIDYKSENVSERLGVLCPKGVDVNFENVGGDIMNAVIGHMNVFGRMPLCGLISGYNAEEMAGPADFGRVLMKRINIQGFIVIDYIAQWADAAAKLAGLALEGKIKWRDHVVDGLENAPSAVNMLFSGANDGKLMVRVSGED
jgi:NADPH-dependent curcumin reductase